jgi:hypothetical protein
MSAMETLEPNQTQVSHSLLGVTWDYTEEHVGFHMHGKPFFPMFDEGPASESSAQNFNGVVIPLEAGMKEDLKWEAARKKAKKAVENSQYILWELDLGFSTSDLLPLSDSAQYLSFQIALDHFQDTLWKEFSKHTFGLILYKGSLDFIKILNWDEHQLSRFQEWLQDCFKTVEEVNKEVGGAWLSLREIHPECLKGKPTGLQILRLFSRDLFTDYLNLLSSALPTEIQLFLMLDCSMISCSASRLQMISLEQFSRYHLILKGHCSEFPSLCWGEGKAPIGRVSTILSTIEPSLGKKVAVLLPSSEIHQRMPFEKTAEGISQLHRHGIDFRLIPEAFLTVQWDGLDCIVVDPSGITPVGKRMLQGFCAAGGTVVALNSMIGLYQEMSLSSWLLQKSH